VVINLVPRIGMKFRDGIETWKFWVEYGGQKSFSVRQRDKNKRKVDVRVTSCRYVSSNEGHHGQDKREHRVKCPRAETRTNYEVHMCLKMDGKGYIVYELVPKHSNHLHLPETLHLMASQRKFLEVQAFEIETADDSRIGPRAAHELASRQVGESFNLSYTCLDHKNYLRTKRTCEMAHGEAGSMLKYFQDKIAKNHSLEPFYFLLFIDTRWCANTSSSPKCLLGQQQGFRRISCRQFLHTTFNDNFFIYYF
jgi:hypothetical protein